MYNITTFEWNRSGALKNIAIPTFTSEDGEPSLIIKSLSMGVEGDRRGFMEVTFTLDNGSEDFRGGAYQFVAEVVRDLCGSYSNIGGKYSFGFGTVSGEPVTETMMKKFLLLMKLCGLYSFAPPRVVTETFTGRWQGDSNPVPYGKYLMDKCLREQFSAPQTSVLS